MAHKQLFLNRTGAPRSQGCPTNPSSAHASRWTAVSSWERGSKEGQGDLTLSEVPI